MIILAAQQSSDSLRPEYFIDMGVYKGYPKIFVFIDDMRSDMRDSMQNLPTVCEEILLSQGSC